MPKRSKTSAKPTPQRNVSTISAEELCGLTGLTDRRHRQLAEQGYFPAPIKSQYQLEPALRGLFSYYRQIDERRRGIREKLDAEKLRKLKLENDETAGVQVSRLKVAEALGAALLETREQLRRLLEEELPIGMASLDVPSARIVGKRHFDKLCERMQALFASWGK